MRDEATIAIDANGSPVTFHEASWLICFVPGLRRQWWHRFADARHKHVFALRPVGDGTWLLVEPWWTRLMVNVLTLDEAIRFLRWGSAGNILQVRESIPGKASQMRGWSNCSVLIAFLLGRSYWTWTPNGLYRRLLRERGTVEIDLSQFLGRHFQVETNRSASAALRGLPRRQEESLDEALLNLGSDVMASMTSPAAVALYKAAVSESTRFRDAADAFWTLGPKRAIGCIRNVLEDARQRGEIDARDCETAARQFVAMLRGDLHLEIIFGLRASADPGEVRAHVRSVVEVFLRGARGSAPVIGADAGRAVDAAAFSLDFGTTQALTACGLIREIGESINEVVGADDWQAASPWAEAVWDSYSASTGISWEQASGRIHEAWKASSTRGYGTLATD
ncbi:MAG TPA: TetR/AcrR family transcriptional regulator C-terminal domain-containing protein [Lysobacter sp.]